MGPSELKGAELGEPTVDDEPKPKQLAVRRVANRALKKMLAHYERQEFKLLKRMERIKNTILGNRDRMKSITNTLTAREKAHADNESAKAA